VEEAKISPHQAAEPPSVTIPGSELRELHSVHTGRDYHIYVGLPHGYGESSDSYPVLYLLDGQWDFRLVSAVYGGLNFDRFIPEMIIVGITYGGEDPDYDALRARDYTPTPVADVPGSGDGPEFLAFLWDELIPFIERDYRVDSDHRVLAGSSFGGLFCLYALFTEPNLFNGYVSISPVIPWDDGLLIRLEDELSRRTDELPARLFLAAGELEPQQWTVDPMQQMAERLVDRGYRGLEVTKMVMAGERHASVKAEAFNRGLRAVLEPQPIEVPIEALQNLVGEYRTVDEGDELHMILAVEAGRLILQPRPGEYEGDELSARTADSFAFRKIPGEITFHCDQAGAVHGATIHLPDGNRSLTKSD
jgi:predicted alpha/beta superfamily hydrolase